jgi:carboxymethylenebutenolidase
MAVAPRVGFWHCWPSNRGDTMATIALKAADGHEFSAYEASPAGTPLGGLVIVQEIFGVTAHIRGVADGFAADGYRAIAPALFDRAEPGVDLDYGPAGVERGRALRQMVETGDMLRDIAATADALKGAGKVAVVGYCLGGSLAWLTATGLDGFAAAVGYYGGTIAAHAGETPRCPVLLHFGETDAGIPMSDVEKVKAATDPAMVDVFTYPAGHAFNRDGGASYSAHSAMLARMRTVKFLQKHVG